MARFLSRLFSAPSNSNPDVPQRDRYWLHVALFIITLVSTAVTGAIVFIGRSDAWLAGKILGVFAGVPISDTFLHDGLMFACSLLGFLTVHEFGHYFAARHHSVRASLPYYIPSPLVGIGTLGAVIRIREQVPTTRKLFDIGAAGPIAGFVAAFGLLLYAMATVPPPEFMFGVGGHEALRAYIERTGHFPESVLSEDTGGSTMTVGNTALYWILSQFFQDLPPMYEMYHYPMLFAAWLGLFFTALNLLPVGQLDGGHILYSLVGPTWHGRLARGFMILMLVSTAIGLSEDAPHLIGSLVPNLARYPLLVEVVAVIILVGLLLFLLRRFLSGRVSIYAAFGIMLVAELSRAVGPALTQFGYSGWLLWCFLLIFFVRIDHPPVLTQERLTHGRRLIGILSLVIFLLCFSIRPLYFA